MSPPRPVREFVDEHLSQPEKRLSIRYRCRARGDCQPVTANEAGNHWPVRVFDISEGGVGLVLSRRFEPGTLLAVELNCSSKRPAYMPLARISRVTPCDTHWLLGCVWQGAFGADELQNLVGAASMWQAVHKRYRKTRAVLERLCGQKPSEATTLPSVGAA